MLCIKLGDYLGRRLTIFIATLASTIGAVLMSTSTSLAQLVVARLVLGLGTGGYTATVPVWQSEMSKPHNRGSQVVIEGFFAALGITIALWVDFGFYFLGETPAGWRVPLGLQVVLSVTVMALVFTLPESPRWLIKKDRLEEAREIMSILGDLPSDSELIGAGMADIRLSLAIAGTGSMADLFQMGRQRIFHRAVLAATGQMFQQMSGICLITFYTTTIFQQDLHFDAMTSRVLSCTMEIMQPIGALIAFYTIDRYGRRPLMLASAAGMSVCMACLAGTTSAPSNGHALTAAVAFLFLCNMMFPIGFLGLTFLYATEVAPLHLRAAISGIATATAWLFNFLVTEITPVGFSTISYRYYIIYAIINASMVPVIYFCFPETNGRTLEEMDDIFSQSLTIFDPPRLASILPKREPGERVAALDAEKAVTVDCREDRR